MNTRILNTSMLAGFAEDVTERSTAESVARNVDGVRQVNNEVFVRP
jgi:osmotically-inducible protein OsmY